MYKSDAAAATADIVADLRSDTVTKPTRAMRAAMADAEVGDDVYGDDPTVNRLEAVVAERLGKEAALFCASGTQSNLLGVLGWCGRGDEILVGDSYHVFAWEARGASVLGGATLHPLPTDAGGALRPADIAAAVKPDDPHMPITRLLSLENTVSGQVIPLEHLKACADAARAHGLAVHLDGARLMNAAVAQGCEASEITAVADSVSLCLSKGLGAPVGSVLAGPADLIAKARRMRKMVGGGMRQAGVLAAAGLYALDHHVTRLADDHGRAAALADKLAAFDALAVTRTPTNMIFVTPPAGAFDTVSDALRDAGVRVNRSAPTLRFVTHLDVGDAAIDSAAAAFERAL
jgi:threonine aldolase